MTMNQRPPEEVIDSIYRAAVDPDGWRAALQRVSTAFGGEGTILYLFDAGGRLVNGAVAWPYTKEGFKEYGDEFQKRDLRFLRLLNSPRHGKTVRTTDLMTTEEINRCAVHQVFYRKYDLWRMVAESMRLPDGVMVVAGHRPRSRSEFSDGEARVFHHYVSHMARAVRVATRLDSVSRHAAAAEQAVSNLDTGVVLLDEHGKVLYVNVKAEAIFQMADGLSVRDSEVNCVRADDDSRLKRLIGDSVETALGRSTSGGGAIVVKRPSGQRSYGVDIMPVPSGENGLFVHRACVAILIVDPTSSSERAATDWLQTAFGLTQMEAKIAQLLSIGEGAELIAERLNKTVGTVRVHAKAIYKKCGVKRQGQLVRLLRTSGVPYVWWQ